MGTKSGGRVLGWNNAGFFIEPLDELIRNHAVTDGSKDGQVLSNTNVATRRGFTSTEIAVLTGIELTRTGEFQTGVKVQNDTAAVTHEVQVGNTGECLDDTGLVIVAAFARAPLAFEGAGETLVDESLMKNETHHACTKEIFEAVAGILLFMVVIFLVNTATEGFQPGAIDALEELLNGEATSNKALITGVVLIGGRVQLLDNAKNGAHTVSQEGNFGAKIPFIFLEVNVAEEFVHENVVDADETESFRELLDVCQGVVCCKNGLGGVHGGAEEFSQGLRFRTGHVREDGIDNVLIGLNPQGAKHYKEWNWVGNLGEFYFHDGGEIHIVSFSHDILGSFAGPVNTGTGKVTGARIEGLNSGVIVDGGVALLFRNVEGIEGLFLAGDKNLFTAVYNEIAAAVLRTFAHGGESRLGFTVEGAIATVEHEGDLGKREVGNGFLVNGGIFVSCIGSYGYTIEDVGLDRQGVGQVTQTGFIGEEDTNIFALIEFDRGDTYTNGSSVQAAHIDFNFVFKDIGIAEGFFYINNWILDGNNGL